MFGVAGPGAVPLCQYEPLQIFAASALSQMPWRHLRLCFLGPIRLS